MKNVVLLICLVLIGLVGWRVASSLSPDAMGLATGVVFGVLAGLPTAVLVLASNRGRGRDDDDPRGWRGQTSGAYPYGGYPQPPVIVLADHPAPAPPQQPYYGAPEAYRNVRALPAPREEERHFRVFGDVEDLVEDDFRA